MTSGCRLIKAKTLMSLESIHWEAETIKKSIAPLKVWWNTKPILESGGSFEGTNIIKLVRLFYSEVGKENSFLGKRGQANFYPLLNIWD